MAEKLITLTEAETLQRAAKDYASAAFPTRGAATLQSGSWRTDNTADYPSYYDLAITGVTATDTVDILFSDIVTAESFGISPVTETSAGSVKIRAVISPNVNLSVNYSIHHQGG